MNKKISDKCKSHYENTNTVVNKRYKNSVECAINMKSNPTLQSRISDVYR